MPDRVKENLVEIIKVYADFLSQDTIDAIADSIIAEGVTMEWISVADHLPASGERVIVCRKGGKVEQGVFLGVNGWWKVYGTNTKSVTHWMPLPQPPKE